MLIRVAIVEDEKAIREGVAALINGSEGFSSEYRYATAEEALREIPDAAPEVVLMDIQLPGMSGIDCIALLKPLCPDTQFIVFTSFEDADSVFSALKAGATGYLTKTTQPSKILDAIVEVCKGGSPMSSHIARKVVASFYGTEKNTERQKLSAREQQILELLSDGYRYKDIADRLFLSTETVRTHIRNIYEKLQVNSRTEALNKVYRK